MFFKGIMNDVSSIAAIPAVPYGIRFQQFIKKKVIRLDVPEKQKFTNLEKLKDQIFNDE